MDELLKIKMLETLSKEIDLLFYNEMDNVEVLRLLDDAQRDIERVLSIYKLKQKGCE